MGDVAAEGVAEIEGEDDVEPFNQTSVVLPLLRTYATARSSTTRLFFWPLPRRRLLSGGHNWRARLLLPHFIHLQASSTLSLASQKQ